MDPSQSDPTRPTFAALFFSDRLFGAAFLLPLVTLLFAHLSGPRGVLFVSLEVVFVVTALAIAWCVWRIPILWRISTSAIPLRADVGMDQLQEGAFHGQVRWVSLTFEHDGGRFDISRRIVAGEGVVTQARERKLTVWFVPHAPRFAALMKQRLLIVRVTKR